MKKMKKNDQLLYGIHPVAEALDSGKTFDKVMVQRGLRGEALGALCSNLRRNDVPLQYVPKVKLDRLTSKNHQGIVGFISPVEFQKLEWLLPSIYEKGETPFLLVLDGITDVRNFGAICRTAECAGVHAVVISAKRSASVSADAVKTSAGALLRLPICRETDLQSALNFMKNSGLEIMTCHEEGKMAYTEANLKIPLALVMGAEDRGIGESVEATSAGSIRIPMVGKTSSLNVSVAAAIVIFETLRQRSQV